MSDPVQSASRLTLGALTLCAVGCGSQFTPPIAATNVESLTFACDPDDLPGAVGEFQIITFSNALGPVDPDSVEGGIVVEGTKIRECLGSGEQPSQAVDQVFDACEHVILPGLINTHHHFYTMMHVRPFP